MRQDKREEVDNPSSTDAPRTPNGYKYVHDVTKPLNQLINSGHSGFQVYQDWIEMILSSLLGDEDAYTEAISEYTESEIKQFAKALGHLQKTTREYEVDVLGDVYEALGMASDNFNQYFTPHNESMLLSDFLQDPTNSQDTTAPQTVADHTCGSGRLLIAASQNISDGVYFGQDKDAVCAKMTVINLCLFNLEGYVAHGDSLTMNVYQAWQTTGTEQGGAVRKIDSQVLEEKLKTMATN